MGWTFYDIETLPEPNGFVWCRWPQAEDKGRPGPVIRPALVRGTIVHEDPEGRRFGSVLVSYATGQFTAADAGRDLIIDDRSRLRSIGLHKPTRVSLSSADCKNLLWCEEYFVSQSYARESNLVLGRLVEAEIERMHECMRRRGMVV